MSMRCAALALATLTACSQLPGLRRGAEHRPSDQCGTRLRDANALGARARFCNYPLDCSSRAAAQISEVERACGAMNADEWFRNVQVSAQTARERAEILLSEGALDPGSGSCKAAYRSARFASSALPMDEQAYAAWRLTLAICTRMDLADVAVNFGSATGAWRQRQVATLLDFRTAGTRTLHNFSRSEGERGKPLEE